MRFIFYTQKSLCLKTSHWPKTNFVQICPRNVRCYQIMNCDQIAPSYPPLEEDDKLSFEIISIKLIYAKHCYR